MQRFPQGLFKPGSLPLAGLMLSCLQVNDERELAAALADGWFECPNQAAASATTAEPVEAAESAPPTRAELEQKASELGVKFDGRTGDKTLADRIAAKLAAG